MTPCTVALQAPLSIGILQEIILEYLMSQFFVSGSQSIGVSAAASLFNEYSGLISFRIDWLDLLAAQGTLKSLLHATPWTVGPPGSSVHGDSPGKNTGVGCNYLPPVGPHTKEPQQPQNSN